MDLKSIRRDSRAELSRFGVQIPESLPLLDEGIVQRAIDEVLDRLLILNVAAAVAYGYDKSRAIRWVERENLSGKLMPSERKLLEGKFVAIERFKLQIEAMYALAWAIGRVESFDFEKPCDGNFATVFPNLNEDQDAASFRASARMLSEDEIIAKCDLAYCLHWALVEAARVGQPLPPFQMGVVEERRRSLDWLLSTVSWDELVLDT